MDNRERQAAFKAAMRSKGFVAATEWVPSEHRELFRAVARALRDGLSVTIGGTGNAVPNQATEGGTSNGTLWFPTPARIAAEALQRIARGEGTRFDAEEVMRLVDPSGKIGAEPERVVRAVRIEREPEPERVVRAVRIEREPEPEHIQAGGPAALLGPEDMRRARDAVFNASGK